MICKTCLGHQFESSNFLGWMPILKIKCTFKTSTIAFKGMSSHKERLQQISWKKGTDSSFWRVDIKHPCIFALLMLLSFWVLLARTLPKTNRKRRSFPFEQFPFYGTFVSFQGWKSSEISHHSHRYSIFLETETDSSTASKFAIFPPCVPIFSPSTRHILGSLESFHIFFGDEHRPLRPKYSNHADVFQSLIYFHIYPVHMYKFHQTV